jgi:hypothetical protein
MLQIVARSRWGARQWTAESTPHTVEPGDRRYFVVHYDGAQAVLREGASIPRAIDVEHWNRGWSGIGYNFVVGQDGTVWEGRGWDRVGAHCPGRNRDGIGVQIAIGGNQVPSAAARYAVRQLYAMACARSRRALNPTWHGAQYPTDCPGPRLIAWVRGGMTDPNPDTTPATGATADAAAAAADPLENALALDPDARAALIRDIAAACADAVTSIRARNPVIVDDGTGAAELTDGTHRDIDALPTVIGEIQHEQRAQGKQLTAQGAQLTALAEGLEQLVAVVRGLATGHPST